MDTFSDLGHRSGTLAKLRGITLIIVRLLCNLTEPSFCYKIYDYRLYEKIITTNTSCGASQLWDTQEQKLYLLPNYRWAASGSWLRDV